MEERGARDADTHTQRRRQDTDAHCVSVTLAGRGQDVRVAPYVPCTVSTRSIGAEFRAQPKFKVGARCRAQPTTKVGARWSTSHAPDQGG